MKNMDSNKNGTISFDEFVRGMYEFVVKHKTTAERRLGKEKGKGEKGRWM